MKVAKQNGSAEIKPSSEADIEGNIHQLISSNDTLRQIENRDAEMSASSVDTMLRRVRETSTREIEDLIDDLQQLHEKLNNDGYRIQHDVEHCAELNQLAMQLTKIIADNVKNLPAGPGIVPRAD
jgi:Zn-dependent oligopeptidase